MSKISYEEFARLDLRVGKVIAAEVISGSRKLVKLSVNDGKSARTVVAGIAESHRPESLVGKTVIVLTNLEPRKLMGVTSEGMLLAAEDSNGSVHLLTAEGEAPPGSKVL